MKSSDDDRDNSGDEDEPQGAPPTLCRMLAKALVALHLKVSWRSCPAGRSGPGFWKRTHAMPPHSPARTGWTSRAMLGDVWGGNRVTLRTRSVDAQIVAFFIILVYC